MIMFSIVIPMYNASKYLCEALMSLKKQRYKDFEVIIVDDGSTDDSVKIAESFTEYDKRFTVIRQNNQYAGIARNNGLDHAKGKYIIFLDADDIFHKDMLQKLYYDIEKYDVDIVTFNYNIFHKKFYKKNIELKYSGELKKPYDIKDDLFNVDPGIPWNKLYKMDFIRRTGLRFQGTVNTNDVYFTRLTFALAESIYFSPHTLISYRSGNSNSVQGKHLKNINAFYIALRGIIDELKDRGLFETYKRTTIKMIIDVCMWKLKAANSVDTLSAVFEIAQKLFDYVGLTSDNPIIKGMKDEIIIKSIINNNKEDCIASLYLAYRSQCYEKTKEYQIGRAIKKIIPFLFK